MGIGTPLIKIYSRYRLRQLARMDAAGVQERLLFRLLRKGRETVFGREHGFARLRTREDYRRAVPLRRYEDFWETYWREAFPRLQGVTWPGRVPYFALTSGTTTGVKKYIPVTRELLASCWKAEADLFVHHFHARPRSRVFGGRSLLAGACAELCREAEGVYSADLSGIIRNETPWYIRPRTFPPLAVARLTDWEARVRFLAREAPGKDIRHISGVPPWLLYLFEEIQTVHPAWEGRLADAFPRLELVDHWGVNIGPYRPMFEDLLRGSGAELRELYPASEGFFAVQDRGPGEGLRLLFDHGIFYEFVPLEELGSANPTRHWVKDAEVGVNYALILTTCAGLWSWVLGDTVRLVDRTPPRLLVTGRTHFSLSSFGEHLIVEELDEAVAAAAADLGLQVRDFSVGTLFPRSAGEPGGHLYVVEFAGPGPAPRQAEAFRTRLHEELSAQNRDYGKLAGGAVVRPPALEPAAPGAFAAWMRKRGRPGGQSKVPRVMNDPDLFGDLRRFVAAYNGGGEKREAAPRPSSPSSPRPP